MGLLRSRCDNAGRSFSRVNTGRYLRGQEEGSWPSSNGTKISHVARSRSGPRQNSPVDAAVAVRAGESCSSLCPAGLPAIAFNSSRSPSARDGHLVRSPQLHQEVAANRPGFLAPTIPRLFSALARKLTVCGVYSAGTTGLGRRTRKMSLRRRILGSRLRGCDQHAEQAFSAKCSS